MTHSKKNWLIAFAGGRGGFPSGPGSPALRARLVPSTSFARRSLARAVPRLRFPGGVHATAVPRHDARAAAYDTGPARKPPRPWPRHQHEHQNRYCPGPAACSNLDGPGYRCERTSVASMAAVVSVDDLRSVSSGGGGFLSGSVSDAAARAQGRGVSALDSSAGQLRRGTARARERRARGGVAPCTRIRSIDPMSGQAAPWTCGKSLRPGPALPGQPGRSMRSPPRASQGALMIPFAALLPH